MATITKRKSGKWTAEVRTHKKYIFRNYLLQKKNQRIILSSYNLGRPFYTSCYVEEVEERFMSQIRACK